MIKSKRRQAARCIGLARGLALALAWHQDIYTTLTLLSIPKVRDVVVGVTTVALGRVVGDPQVVEPGQEHQHPYDEDRNGTVRMLKRGGGRLGFMYCDVQKKIEYIISRFLLFYLLVFCMLIEMSVYVTPQNNGIETLAKEEYYATK